MKSKWMVSLAVVLLAACDLGTSVGDPKDGGLTGTDGGATDGGSDAGQQPTVKRMFVTSGSYNGDFKTLGGGSDGLDGADRLCNTVAQGAGLSGSYKAWLSSSTIDAVDRIADVGPWYQVTSDGTQIKTFNNKANLASTPIAAVEYTENGARLLVECVWTGTSTGGRKAVDTCTGFSTSSAFVFGTMGRTSSTAEWSVTVCAGASKDSCTAQYHLYCFGQ